MLIKQLDIIEYPQNGSHWTTETIINPQWNDIVQAINKLDRDQFPFIWLFSDADAAEDDYPDLSIMGGQGSYLLEGYSDDNYKIYFDEHNNDEIVDIWTSDQGYSISSKNLCHNIEQTLKVVKYFFDHGAFHPDVDWQSTLW